MLGGSRRTFGALAFAAAVSALAGLGPSLAMADDKELTQLLRAGGLIIVLRHGATFPDQADTDPLHPENVAAQRNLNEKGIAAAKGFGEALRQIAAPVGKVHTSQFNRAFETAVLAGFKNIEKTADISEGGLVVSPNENNRRTAAFRKMLVIAPEPGTNTILVTHKPNILDALGKDWFEVSMAFGATRASAVNMTPDELATGPAERATTRMQ